jgi:oxygen-independent coproporphyrinogen-3 oxidase
VRQVRWRDPATYVDKALAGQPVSNEHEVARRDLPFEYVLNALRLREGFAVAEFSARTGLPASALRQALALARARGLVEPADSAETAETAETADAAAAPGGDERVVPTARGFDFLSDLQALFLPADGGRAARLPGADFGDTG